MMFASRTHNNQRSAAGLYPIAVGRAAPENDSDDVCDVMMMMKKIRCGREENGKEMN